MSPKGIADPKRQVVVRVKTVMTDDSADSTVVQQRLDETSFA
jgi:hypothetical protein